MCALVLRFLISFPRVYVFIFRSSFCGVIATFRFLMTSASGLSHFSLSSNLYALRLGIAFVGFCREGQKNDTFLSKLARWEAKDMGSWWYDFLPRRYAGIFVCVCVWAGGGGVAPNGDSRRR